MQSILDAAGSIWLPLILGFLCVIYGLILLISKDPNIINKKNEVKIYKDPEKYSFNSAMLFFFMAIGCVVMFLLLYFVSEMVATMQFVAWFAVFGIIWKKNLDMYGAK